MNDTLDIPAGRHQAHQSELQGSLRVHANPGATLDLLLTDGGKDTPRLLDITIHENARVNLAILEKHTRVAHTDVWAKLAGEHAQFHYAHAALLSPGTRSEAWLRVAHEAPHTVSRFQTVAAVPRDAHAERKARVRIENHARRSDSRVDALVLTLDPRAHADALQPDLEILTQDVKAGHSAATAPLSTEDVFYLRQRGLDEDAARQLLVAGRLVAPVARVNPAWTQPALTFLTPEAEPR